MTESHESKKNIGTMVDGLSLWEAEITAAPAALSIIRLDLNERFLIPFSAVMQRVEVHYLDAAAVRSYVHCNGINCLLCRAGLSKDTRDLWPLYDVVDRTVGILAITPNMRPHSLRSQLYPVLQQIKGSKNRILLTMRQDNQKFSVGCSGIPEDVDDGATCIADFLARIEKGDSDFSTVFPRYSNDELQQIEEVARRLSAKGIKAA